MSTVKRRFSLLIWKSFRDCSLLAIMCVVIWFIQQARQQKPIHTATPRTLLALLALFVLAWLATLIACRMGGTTMGDHRPKGHVATSVAVSTLTAFVGAIVFMLLGFFG